MTKQEIQTRLDSFQQLFVKSDSDLTPEVELPSKKIQKVAGEAGTKERIEQYRAMVENNQPIFGEEN